MDMTCVPCPWSSYGVLPVPMKSLKVTVRPAICSWLGSTPVSTTQMPTPVPATPKACRAAAAP
jgi:hypothetical protein